MRRFVLAVVMPLMLILSGCGVKQNTNSSDAVPSENQVYHSNISAEDCYLCGSGTESLISAYWGQNNIALISLNTFEIKPIEINRYDVDGLLIEEYAGVVAFGGGISIDGGFSAHLLQDYDRGYATGTLEFFNDEILDIEKAASFLCADCLNEILAKELSRCFGVGAINLDTKEMRLFEENLGGFGLGDFYFDCDLKEQKNGDTRRMGLLIFYCPLRYGPEP